MRFPGHAADSLRVRGSCLKEYRITVPDWGAATQVKPETGELSGSSNGGVTV